MGKIIHMTYTHDDWCRTLFTRNMKDCKCKPEVKIEVSTGDEFTKNKLKEDFDGFVKEKQKYN